MKATSGVYSTVTAPSGAVVGDTDAQTLTNKTLTRPAIATISNTGTLTLPTATTTLVGTDTSDTLSNKTHDNTNQITAKDTKFTLQDNDDPTKQAQFELSGITTGTTRSIALPNANTTLVGTDATQTLTNKTLTQPTISDLTHVGHVHTNAASGGTLSAAAIASGTFAVARLGSGTPDGTTFLRGDGTWAAPSTSSGSSSLSTDFDESLGGSTTSGASGKLGWGLTIVSSGTLAISDGTGHPGMVTAATAATIGSYALIHLGLWRSDSLDAMRWIIGSGATATSRLDRIGFGASITPGATLGSGLAVEFDTSAGGGTWNVSVKDLTNASSTGTVTSQVVSTSDSFYHLAQCYARAAAVRSLFVDWFSYTTASLTRA